MPLINIVGHGAGGRAGALAHRDSDALPVGQADHHWATGDRSTHTCGVGDGPALGYGWRGRQGDRRGVGHIRDRSADLGLICDQVLVTAARHVADAVGDGGMALVNVVTHGAGGGARTLPDRDGNRLAIGQRDHHRAAGDGCAHAGRVEDGPSLGYGWCGRQGDRRRVGHIGDAGADLGLVGHQVFIVSARHITDAVADGRMALVDVIGDYSSGGAGTLADRDGDGLAVGQGDHYCRTGDRCGDRGGVDNGSAFGHRWRGAQADSRGINAIGDVGHRWRAVDREVFEVAARCIGNVRSDLSGVEIRVITMAGNVDAAGSLVGADGDGLAIAEGDSHRGLRCVGQGGGVNDLATLGHARRRRQRHRGGVLHVCDAGADRRFVSDQVFVIATGHVADAVGDGGMALINVVADGARGSARALADGDGDALAIGQGHHDRAAGNGGTDGSGVEDGAAFGHGRRGRQGDRRRVGHIADAGADLGLVGHQILVVAATDIADAVGDGRMALIEIVADGGGGSS